MKYWVELPEVWATEFLDDDPQCNGYWISSLTQSWQKGYPDNCVLPWVHYVDLVRRLRLQTGKPIIVDVDMLFNEPSIAATIARELYHVGCNTIVVESKRFPKVNSLTPGNMKLSLPDEFCRLLNKVKRAAPEIELIARVEHLAITKDVERTCSIARRSVSAGADGVIIHWGVDSDTHLLKETLSRLKANGIKTGIIPTKYLEQLRQGAFDELAEFAILGNICSSYIRNAFSAHSVSSLLEIPCMFKPILERASSHEPKGHKTLLVLGAMPLESGKYILEDPAVLNAFLELPRYYRKIFVVAPDTNIEIDDPTIDVVRIENSKGQVDSLNAALDYLNTERVTVAYADIEAAGFEHIRAKGLVFIEDVFAGVINISTQALVAIARAESPFSSILKMAMANNVPSSIITPSEGDA